VVRPSLAAFSLEGTPNKVWEITREENVIEIFKMTIIDDTSVSLEGIPKAFAPPFLSIYPRDWRGWSLSSWLGFDFSIFLRILSWVLFLPVSNRTCWAKSSSCKTCKNVLVAYMTWEDYNFEDALISEHQVYGYIFTSFHIRKYEI
jgi:hypothetical protein